MTIETRISGQRPSGGNAAAPRTAATTTTAPLRAGNPSSSAGTSLLQSLPGGARLLRRRQVGQVPEQGGVIGPLAERVEVRLGEQVGNDRAVLFNGLAQQSY